MPQPDLRQQHFRTARVDAADNGAARLYEATPDPKMPYIKGAQQLVGGILNKAQQVYETQREAERQSDIIAAKAEYHKREQLAWEKIQNATVGGDDASLEGLEKLVEQTFAEMDEEYSQWMQQHTKGGILNVRAAETRAELDLYRQQRLADAQLKATGYLYNKRREETVNRFNIGLEEAVADSGPEAEKAIKGIATAMRGSGFDPEQVRVKEEAALQTISITRLERDLQNLQSQAYEFTTEEQVRSLDDEFKALEQALTPGSELHEASGYRHMTPAQLEKARAAIPQAKKSVTQSVMNRIREKEFFAQQRRKQEDDRLYRQSIDEKNPLTQEQLDQELKDNKIDPELHSRYMGLINSRLKMQQDMRREQTQTFTQVTANQFMRQVKAGNFTKEDAFGQLDLMRMAGTLKESDYNRLIKEVEGIRGEGGEEPGHAMDLLMMQRQGIPDKVAYEEAVMKAAESGELTFAQAEEQLKNVRTATPEANELVQVEMDRMMDQIRLAQQGKSVIRFGVYRGRDDDPQAFNAARAGVYSDPFDENVKSRNFEYVTMTPVEIINFRSMLERFVRKHPDADEVKLREYAESLIEGKSIEEAKNKYRFQTITPDGSQAVQESVSRFSVPLQPENISESIGRQTFSGPNF